MPELSRKEFVMVCSKAIIDTRGRITVQNQLSGYKKYHMAIRDDYYLETQRKKYLMSSRKHQYIYRHDLIEHMGLGNCAELAQFLLVEIGKKIDALGAVARIRRVSSEKYDHSYLEIRIGLTGEKTYSLWEVDAWDPRVIDISTRPDGSIKNHNSLDYGYATTTIDSVYSDELNYTNRYFFFDIPKPQSRKTLRSPTPERDMLRKNEHFLYDDCSIDGAIKKRKLAPDGDLHYLQKPSTWQ